MPAQLDPSNILEHEPQDGAAEALRLLSRSPHPYHRRSVQLHQPLDLSNPSTIGSNSPALSRPNVDDERGNVSYVRDGTPSYIHSTDSDSGTEADDEHFLKGLPAPRIRGHKGLISENGILSGASSPLIQHEPVTEGDTVRGTVSKLADGLSSTKPVLPNELWQAVERIHSKRRRELRRRAIEVLLLGSVGGIVLSGTETKAYALQWKTELYCELSILSLLLLLYPIRTARPLASAKYPQRWPTLQIPSSFDPAPLLYPLALPVFVAWLLGPRNPSAMLLNISLSLASIPPELVPNIAKDCKFNNIHWFIACCPIVLSQSISGGNGFVSDTIGVSSILSAETLMYAYHLHQALCVTLHYLTTTSLLTAELQLLSVALVNVLLLSNSPQAIILKAVVWIGGVGTFLSCSNVLSWVVALARVPKWRFKRAQNVTHQKHNRGSFSVTNSFPFIWLRNALGSHANDQDDENSLDDEPKATMFPPFVSKEDCVESEGFNGHIVDRQDTDLRRSASQNISNLGFSTQRRHTIPSFNQTLTARSSKMTPSGRKKRSTSSSVQSFFHLTEHQAVMRKWLYASYVYICIIAIILVFVREYVGRYALQGTEPFGWALGYLFGNLPRFRMEVMTANLERWVCLPNRGSIEEIQSCDAGWVEHLRQSTFGPASTRLLLLGYWSVVIATGLAIVLRLSAVVEVDTRRKVFHFMMVAMLLPATYIDPTYAALALALVLAVFLLLDLFRASQLPPLSKPLAYFLTPYVDGRDLRGPVVISHIFLLIGCAIPLWLSLGAVERTGTGCVYGWEVPTRDVSMVSGVICVGLGDAAASLIGRRYGRHKWFWAGGKSIEGSVAFASAVGLALVIAKVWLVVGRWPDGGEGALGLATIARIAVAAAAASLTEAVLTGGNDNVVVPVVLWLCVKGLRI